jgi:tRNA 2-thiouridine synthesizing protein B
MPILHVISHSPSDRTDLASCSRLITSNDALILFSNGVYAALADTAHSHHIERLLNGGVPVYVLKLAQIARGLTDKKLIAGVTQVDYDGFVSLVERYAVTQSW